MVTRIRAGTASDFERTLAGALGEATPRVRLDAPGEAPEEELLVAGSGLLAEDLAVLLLELRRGLVGRGARLGVAALTDLSYPRSMGAMKGITIKLPEANLRQLRQRARQSGRSVAALVRELVEAPPPSGGSVYSITSDLAGSLAGGRQPATNARRRFRRS